MRTDGVAAVSSPVQAQPPAQGTAPAVAMTDPSSKSPAGSAASSIRGLRSTVAAEGDGVGIAIDGDRTSRIERGADLA